MVNKCFFPTTDEEGYHVKNGGGDLLWEGDIEVEKSEVFSASSMHRERLDAESKKFTNDAAGSCIQASDSVDISN